jgi:hypothetical protein
MATNSIFTARSNMARQEQQKVKFIQMVLQEHNNYWENKTTEMKKYLDAYNTRVFGILKITTPK